VLRPPCVVDGTRDAAREARGNIPAWIGPIAKGALCVSADVRA
jgi:hypothetical protein